MRHCQAYAILKGYERYYFSNWVHAPDDEKRRFQEALTVLVKSINPNSDVPQIIADYRTSVSLLPRSDWEVARKLREYEEARPRIEKKERLEGSLPPGTDTKATRL